MGTGLWGMVLEVTPRGLVVSLPYGMRGTVAPEQVRDELNAHARTLVASAKAADFLQYCMCLRGLVRCGALATGVHGRCSCMARMLVCHSHACEPVCCQPCVAQSSFAGAQAVVPQDDGPHAVLYGTSMLHIKRSPCPGV